MLRIPAEWIVEYVGLHCVYLLILNWSILPVKFPESQNAILTLTHPCVVEFYASMTLILIFLGTQAVPNFYLVVYV